jgi:7,8-dihydropterin-6-yl-methyl-4-(beta-D-ribofuranosyl)aminobenzene 5'-phosphate synthase
MQPRGRLFHVRSALFVLSAVCCWPFLSAAQTSNRVTILYDAFGKSPGLTKDWGFSALLQYGGKRILFDVGNNAEHLAHNVKVLKADLRKLDFVVISHRHADHTGGLNYLFTVNPDVKIYVPDEPSGYFGAKWKSKEFYRRDESLPAQMRYFDGNPPESLPYGSPWPRAHFIPVSTVTEVAPGIYLLPTISNAPGTLELRELSMAVRSPQGLILLDGCSHAGVERILEVAGTVDKHIHVLFGGLHLVRAPDAEVQRMVGVLHDEWKLDQIAPGHCTGEPEFAALKKTFGERYLYAGVGSVINLP